LRTIERTALPTIVSTKAMTAVLGSLLSFGLKLRTRADWHQAVIAPGHRGPREGPLIEVQHPKAAGVALSAV
jgi:hypothetical protein